MANGTDGRVELKDLEANEVSFVDSPAIGEKFVVVKRQKGGKEMADDKDKVKDEETQGKKDEEKTDEEKEEETQGKDEEKTDEKKDEETHQSKSEMVSALKGIMNLVNRLMKMVGMGGYGEAKKSADEDGDSADSLLAQAEFMLNELNEGRIPDAEAVAKAGKRVTPARLKRLEAFSEELGKFISDLKGEEETEAKGEDEKKETKKSDDPLVGGDVGAKILAELDKVNKRLDKVEAGAGASRGESEDEGGDKEKTEKRTEGDMSSFFVGIGGIQ